MKGSPKAPTVFDLLKPTSYQYLKSLFSKFDIKIDPKLLILQNQNKETILQKILTELDNSPKIINICRQSFHQIMDDEMIEILSQEKNLKDLRIFNIIHCLLLNASIENALAYFTNQEKMKEIQKELHEYLIKIADAEYARQLLISETERIKMQELNAKLNQVIVDEMKLFYDTSFDQLSEIHKQVVDCNARIIQFKEQKKELRKMLNDESKQAANRVIVEYRDRRTGENPFENVNEEILGTVIDQFQNEMGRAEWDLEMLDEKDKEDTEMEKADSEREAFLRNQLKDKEIELKYTSKKIPSSKPTVHVPGIEKKLIKDEQKIYENELLEILGMRELRNKQIQDRDVIRQEIQYHYADILPNIIKQTNDPVLSKLLNDSVAMNYLSMSANLKIGEIVENKKRMNKQIYVTEKEKQSHLFRADQYIKNDEKIMENCRAFPINQTVDALVRLQREKNAALHKQIHQTAFEIFTPEQRRKLEQGQYKISKKPIT